MGVISKFFGSTSLMHRIPLGLSPSMWLGRTPVWDVFLVMRWLHWCTGKHHEPNLDLLYGEVQSTKNGTKGSFSVSAASRFMIVNDCPILSLTVECERSQGSLCHWQRTGRSHKYVAGRDHPLTPLTTSLCSQSKEKVGDITVKLREEQYNKDMTLKEAEILALTTLRQAPGKVSFLHISAWQSFAAPQPSVYYNFLSLFIYDTRYTWLSPGWFVELYDFVWGVFFLAGHGREVEQIQHRGWSGASIYWQVFGLSITTVSKVSRMCGSAAQLVDSFMTAWLWGSAVTMLKNLKMWLLACMEPKSSTALHSWSSQGAELFPGCTEASAMTRFLLRR